jgi:hypothetical protein
MRVDVAVGLQQAPWSTNVELNIFQVIFGCGREHIQPMLRRPILRNPE